MHCDRTMIPKWIDGTVAKPREFTVKRLITVAFGDENSRDLLAVELRAAYAALGTSTSAPAVEPVTILPPKPDRFAGGSVRAGGGKIGYRLV